MVASVCILLGFTMASPLFVVYAVSCITLTLLVAYVWHACVLVVAVHGFWFVARL